MRLAAGRARRPLACDHADPAAQQDRHHDGDLHRGRVLGDTRGVPQARATSSAPEATAALCCCTQPKRPDPDRIEPVTWSPVTESNRRPSPYHGDALPTELTGPYLLV